jgi:hypothetical protein
MALKAGSHGATAGGGDDDFDGSMAQAIEDAFLAEWPKVNPDLPVPTEPAEEPLKSLRLFFAAVAQGVVRHLEEHPEAFTLSVASVAHSHSGGDHVHGDGSHTHSDGSHTHAASVAAIITE